MKYLNKYTISNSIKSNPSFRRQKYVVRPHNSRKKCLSITLLQLFRNTLLLVKTKKDFKRFLKNNSILINGDKVKESQNHKRPIATGEKISINGQTYLVLMKNNKICCKKSSSIIYYGVRGITRIKKGKIQLNLYHNYNFLIDKNSTFLKNSTVRLIEGRPVKVDGKCNGYVLLSGLKKGLIVNGEELKIILSKNEKLEYYGVIFEDD